MFFLCQRYPYIVLSFKYICVYKRYILNQLVNNLSPYHKILKNYNNVIPLDVGMFFCINVTFLGHIVFRPTSFPPEIIMTW